MILLKLKVSFQNIDVIVLKTQIFDILIKMADISKLIIFRKLYNKEILISKYSGKHEFHAINMNVLCIITY